MDRSATAYVPGERIVAIDALRGFALFGIVIVHMVEQYLGAPPPASVPNFGTYSLADKIAQVADGLLFIGKFFTIFSLLFGVSFFIQMDRAASKGMPFRGRFVWRLAVLFAIGAVHHMIYRGDILTIYAMLGVLLVPFYRASDRVLLAVAALLCLGIPRLLITAVGTALGGGLSLSVDDAANVAYFETLRRGAIVPIWISNIRDGFLLKLEFQFGIFGRGYQTLGLFLLGLCIGRWRWHERVSELRPLLRRLTKWGAWTLVGTLVVFGVTAFIVGPVQKPTPWQAAIGLALYDVFNLSFSLVLVGGFLLAYLSSRFGTVLRHFAPVGRMALTVYLIQSLIGTAIFYGYGLGLVGRIGSALAMLLGFVIFGLQMAATAAWLRRFRYGPVEWLWRSLTYGRLQPLHAVPPDSRLATEA